MIIREHAGILDEIVMCNENQRASTGGWIGIAIVILIALLGFVKSRNSGLWNSSA